MTDRPIWRLVKIRASDVQPGDVIRDSFGKWNTVKDSKPHGDDHVTIRFVALSEAYTMRNVHLVDLQVVKPS